MFKKLSKESKFIINYFKKFQTFLELDKQTLNKILLVKNILLDCQKKNNKVIIFGNGGSSSIANHFSVDITKNAGIRSVTFNEVNLITCFANDFGYENWISRSINYYAKKNDVIIAISSSGKSKNIINACKVAKKIGIKKIITLTGFAKNNKVSKLGCINFWINSKIYNYVENMHQIILLSIIDLIISSKR